MHFLHQRVSRIKQISLATRLWGMLAKLLLEVSLLSLNQYIKKQHVKVSAYYTVSLLRKKHHENRCISATRSYHSYDLVADMDFAQCNKVIS